MARILGEPTVPGKIPGGVTVLKKYQGGSGSNPGRANCSREDSNTRKGSSNPGGELVFPGIDPKWCSVPSNTRKGSSNPGRGTGVSWYDSRWGSVTSSSVYSRSPFCL